MALIDEIREDLQAIQTDIPAQIQTGIPQNVKSQNIRSIHSRSTQSALDILDLIEAIENSNNVLYGTDDPNEVPPLEDFGPGYFYVQMFLNEFSYYPVAFFIYNPVAEIQWWKIQNIDGFTRLYGTDVNPNLVLQLNVGRKVGDLYIQTTTGDVEGERLAVWFFVGLQSGVKWIDISSNSSAVLYTVQTLTGAQQRQALKNLGYIQINGNLFEYRKRPSNPGFVIVAGDVALNGWITDSRFGKILTYRSGDPTEIASWDVLEEI